MLRGEGSGDGERGGDGACGSGLSQMGGVLGRQSYNGVAAAMGGGGRAATLAVFSTPSSLRALQLLIVPVPRDGRRYHRGRGYARRRRWQQNGFSVRLLA